MDGQTGASNAPAVPELSLSYHNSDPHSSDAYDTGNTVETLQPGVFMPRTVSTVYEDELAEEARDTTGALASSSSYTGRTVPEDPAETQAVEDNLRRWSEMERFRRRNSRYRRPPAKDNASLTGGATGLVRRLSSIRMPKQQQNTLETPIEMISSSGFKRNQEYNPVGDVSELSPTPNADAPHFPTIDTGLYSRDESYGDLASPSLDDIPSTDVYRTLNKGKGSAIYMQPSNTSEAEISPPVTGKPQRRAFPLVTAGKQSNRQYQRSQIMPQQAAQDQSTNNAPSLGETEPFPSSRSLSTMHKILPDTSLQDVRLHASSMSTENVSKHDNEERRPSWYWSDLICGCGLFSTSDDEDEQAARTNPME